MNISVPKNLASSNSSHASSTSQIRASHLRPPLHLETKGPSFLQQTRVSLHVPKHDNELPDYSNSPIILSDDQHSVRSLNMLSGLGTLDGSAQSSQTKASGLIHKDTLAGHRSSAKPSITSQQKSRGSNPDTIDVFQEQKQARSERKFKRIATFLNNKWVNLFMIVLTLYGLYGEDLGTLATSLNSREVFFDTLTIICCSFFFIEIFLNFLAHPEYRWTFFFWLDLVSTGSLIVDLSFINSKAIDVQADSTQIARAGRISKLGARLGRVVTAFRLFRYRKSVKTEKETDNLFLNRAHTQSVQSLTNLVDNIAKNKMQSTVHASSPAAPLMRGRTSIEPQRRRTLFGPKDGDDEKTPLTGHLPRRLSKFAAGNKDNSELIEKPMVPKRKIDPSKTITASITRVPQKAPDGTAAPVDTDDLPGESRVGKILSLRATNRVIVIVLVLLILAPMMTSDAWSETPVSYVYDIDFVRDMLFDGSVTTDQAQQVIWDIIERHKSTITPIIYFKMPQYNIDYQVGKQFETLRKSQVDIVDVPDVPDMIVAVDLTINAKVTAGTNIARTTFVCVLLVVGSLLFSKDANKLVLRPLERMVEKVNRIAVSPLSVKRESLMDETQKKNETAVLENAITKLGTLLALGFGDAGASIIAQNIAQAGDMNTMLSGEKVMAIFGFCDIRNFTDVTEVLQEDVMVFVNSIADIVHDKVDKYGGAANKNIGDAFLLVWKFPDSEIEEMDDEIQLKNTDLVRGLADLSLYSFLKIYAKINQSSELRKYRSNPKIIERLPNYRVKMGFGLHVGWAIEGAIGSEYKIDASYLSPNVNIASRLEAATKQYGVPLLISNDLYVLLSEDVQKFCKKIDVVMLKGSQVPIALYTIDLDSTELRDKGPSKRQKKDRIRKHEQKKQRLFELICEGKLSTRLLFEKDKDLKIAMKENADVDLKRVWDEGFEAYVEGDWRKARLMFDRYLVSKERDGPSNTLLNYMRSLDYRSPVDWRGFRELTEK